MSSNKEEGGGGSGWAPLVHQLFFHSPRLVLRWWQKQASAALCARVLMLHKATALFERRALAQTWLLWSAHTLVATHSCSARRAPYLSWLGWKNGYVAASRSLAHARRLCPGPALSPRADRPLGPAPAAKGPPSSAALSKRSKPAASSKAAGSGARRGCFGWLIGCARPCGVVAVASGRSQGGCRLLSSLCLLETRALPCLAVPCRALPCATRTSSR